MFPFLEKRQQGGVIDTEESQDPGYSDITDIALQAIAGHMMACFKNGDTKELALALKNLCNLIAEDDDDSDALEGMF